jgi:drug/metabolite transporter (DMT)-like permease
MGSAGQNPALKATALGGQASTSTYIGRHELSRAKESSGSRARVLHPDRRFDQMGVGVKDGLSPRMPLVAVGIAVLLWSTSFGLSAEVLRTASPAVLSVGRFVIGLVILLPIAARRSGFTIALRQPRTVLLGLLGVALYYSLTNVGLEFTTPGTAALSNAALPALTAISGLLILRERLGPRTIVGLVLATAGVAIVAGSGLGLDLGVVLCLIGLTSYALYTVLLRRETVSSEPAGRVAGSPAPERVDPIVLATARPSGAPRSCCRGSASK